MMYFSWKTVFTICETLHKLIISLTKTRLFEEWCNAALLWSSRNVCWTKKYWIFHFVWVNSSFNGRNTYVPIGIKTENTITSNIVPAGHWLCRTGLAGCCSCHVASVSVADSQRHYVFQLSLYNSWAFYPPTLHPVWPKCPLGLMGIL